MDLIWVIFEPIKIEITGDLKISESTRRRPNSFQLRDFNGRTILAAQSREEMNDWIHEIRKHKSNLKKLVVFQLIFKLINVLSIY